MSNRFARTESKGQRLVEVVFVVSFFCKIARRPKSRVNRGFYGVGRQFVKLVGQRRWVVALIGVRRVGRLVRRCRAKGFSSSGLFRGMIFWF